MNQRNEVLDRMLAVKGSPGDKLISMLGGGGLMDLIQSGGTQFPTMMEFAGTNTLPLMQQYGGVGDPNGMRNKSIALDMLNEWDQYQPTDMSQAYAQAPQLQQGEGMASLMNMINSMGQGGQQQSPGQGYQNPYLMSLMGG